MNTIKQGFAAFILFFAIIVFAKLLNSFVVGDKLFVIDNKDIYLALLGVVLSFLVNSLEKISRAYK